MNERLRNGIATFQKDILVDGTAIFFQKWGWGHDLKPQGKRHLAELSRKIKTGERSNPISNFGILDGFGYTAEGTELLENQKGVLILSNHSVKGPLRGYGNTLLIDYLFHQATGGEEIRWAQGHGSSIIEKIHDVLGKTMNTITVGNGTGIAGAKELLRAWGKRESVGLYPEGIQKKKLQKGDPRAGKVIIMATNRGIPIFCVSSYFEHDVFRVSVNRLSPTIITHIGSSPEFAKNSAQVAVDYAMITIAKELPRELQGYYQPFADSLPDLPNLPV